MKDNVFQKINSNTVTDNEIYDRIHYISNCRPEIEKLIAAAASKVARKATQNLVQILRADQDEALTKRAEVRCTQDELFKQYCNFVLLISFESGHVTYKNYVTNFQAIKAAARESEPLIHEVFYG